MIRIPVFDRFNVREGLIATITFSLVTATVTGLIENPLYVRKVPLTALDYIFLFTTSMLAGLYFGKEKSSVTEGRLMSVGRLTGFLAFGCPICNLVLLAFFSTSVIMTYFDPLRPLLGLFSTLILAILLFENSRK
mgnify:CR=1 FL=1